MQGWDGRGKSSIIRRDRQTREEWMVGMYSIISMDGHAGRGSVYL